MSEARDTIKTRVQGLLETYPEARSSDKVLAIKYWQTYDNVNLTEGAQAFLERATSHDTISRARRQIQRSGLFLPPAETVSARRARQDEARAYYAAQAR